MYRDFFADQGQVIDAEADYGYPVIEGRRSGIVWSQQPWHEVDDIRHPQLPSGRFIAGLTSTPVGHVHAAGVCIPKAKAHVDTGRRARAMWEDQLADLEGLAAWPQANPGRMVLLGDFSQRVPRRYQPQRIFDALRYTVLERLKLATAGEIAGIGRPTIDHICHSPDLSTDSVADISNIAPATSAW